MTDFTGLPQEITPVGHLAYFRQDGDGYSFRIRKDGNYWEAVRQLQRKPRYGLSHNQEAHEFNLPCNWTSRSLLWQLFSEEWEIILETNPGEITFQEKGGQSWRVTQQ